MIFVLLEKLSTDC